MLDLFLLILTWTSMYHLFLALNILAQPAFDQILHKWDS